MRSRLHVGRSSMGVLVAVLALCAASIARLEIGMPAPAPPLARRLLPHAELALAPGTATGSSVVAAFERGVAAYNADDSETAMDAFEEAVRLAPSEPEAHINLGLVYLRLQRPEDAMRELAQGASLAQCQKPPGGKSPRVKRSGRHRCKD